VTPLRNRLSEARKCLKLPWEALERDYLLSWILASIAQTETLKETLVFKEGTALKKCYFGDYRFSEDLDFSAVGNFPTGEAMENAMEETCAQAVKLVDPYAPVEISCERYTEWTRRYSSPIRSERCSMSMANPFRQASWFIPWRRLWRRNSGRFFSTSRR